MISKSIEQEWREFAKVIFEEKTPTKSEFSQMRAAFYGGATAVTMTAIELADEDMPDGDAAVEYLQQCRADIIESAEKFMREEERRN